eukprot:m.1527984 g.1527984  ORF g.1527984 m.1527984 type:complete len:195 (-) comp25237_c1_seq3:342-926(-)
MENVRNYCFICSLPSHAFEQGGDANGFARHMKREHGMWSYVYYTLHLKSIDPEEFNYHEKYLHDMLIKEKDITPFPIKNALSLQHHEVDETKEKLTAIQKAFSELKNRLYRRFEESDKEQQSTREIEALWNWQKKNLGGGAGKMGASPRSQARGTEEEAGFDSFDNAGAESGGEYQGFADSQPPDRPRTNTVSF